MHRAYRAAGGAPYRITVRGGAAVARTREPAGSPALAGGETAGSTAVLLRAVVPRAVVLRRAGDQRA
ncbi:hypothetical protein GCM10010508_54530 [Streptomyces naganishii JCM 4654]|uniref:Uncharacterized protein n=1 Tax=Streptomyces naganishii JCM 4654 TaxID=1306179 RepID=A0A918Y7W3_9ACTN|nr:hypothetical protein GCM10010508_54530 [Streptomyces naganishii JCM 4654]